MPGRQQKEPAELDSGRAARLPMQRISDLAAPRDSCPRVTPTPGTGDRSGEGARELPVAAGSGRLVSDAEIRELLADGYRKLAVAEQVSRPQAIAHNYMVMQRAIDDRSALTLEVLDQALLSVAAARVGCEQKWGHNPYAEVQDQWQSVFGRLRAERVLSEREISERGLDSLAERSREHRDPPSGEKIREVLVAVINDYEAEFVALGADGRPGGYRDWPLASGYESVAHALTRRIRHQTAATFDDVAEVRAWLAAGAVVRVETDGFDILAEHRARWLARLDDLVGPSSGEESQTPSRPLGDRIREARVHAGLSLRDVARACQVNPSTPFRWEHGAAVPEVRRRRAMAQLFNLPMSYFTPDLR